MMADAFLRNATDTVRRISDYSEPKQIASQESRLLIFTGGTQIEKIFTADGITPLGQTALNNLRSVFEDYGDALTPEEQLAIIAELFGEIIR